MMFRYEGVHCPSCGEELTERDDIVVCPVCGAPHHRDCWTKQSACYFEDKHGTEEAWKPPEHAHQTVRCPHCGAINAGSEGRCNACGESMRDGTPVSKPQDSAQKPFNPFSFSTEAALQAGSIPKTETFEDATAEEIGTFIGQNTAYYIKKFWLIHKQKKLGSFNFAALFFPGLWMLYRKMYRLGALVTGVIYGLEFLAIYVSIQWSAPVIDGVYTRAGVKIGAYDVEAMLRLGEEAMKMSAGDWLLAVAPLLIYCIVLAISIYLCVMGNKLYYRHVLRKIRGIRAAQPDKAACTTALLRQGGINFSVVISVGICYSLISRLFEIYLSTWN